MPCRSARGLGDRSAAVVLARAVFKFLSRDWASALCCLEDLDRIAPIEKFGAYTMDNAQRMRRYLKARCFYELKEHARSRDAVEVYLRRSENTAGAGE